MNYRIQIICILIILSLGCSNQSENPTANQNAMQAEQQTCCFEGSNDQSSLVTPWIQKSARVPVKTQLVCVNQNDEEVVFQDVVKMPGILAFFYTRCENPNKCSRTVAFSGQIQESLKEKGLGDCIQITLMTFEPNYDHIDDIRDFAVNRGVKLSSQLNLLAPKNKFNAFLNELAVPVSYSNDNVASHDVCIYLLDENCSVVRRYQFYIWDLEAIMTDLERALNEVED